MRERSEQLEASCHGFVGGYGSNISVANEATDSGRVPKLIALTCLFSFVPIITTI